MRSPNDILDAVRAALAAEPHLRWGYVFGSVARGESFRDVDVAVMPAPSMPAGTVIWGQLLARLEDAVANRVDLADLSQPDLPFVGPMLHERIVVLDREPTARHGWEADTTSRWLDFRPCYEEAERVRGLAMQRRLRGAP